MQKAKSRLKKTIPNTSSRRPIVVGSGQLTKRVVHKVSRWAHSRQQHEVHGGMWRWLLERWRLLALVCFGILSVAIILIFIRPSAIADWPLPQIYLLLLIMFGVITYAVARLWLQTWHASLVTLVVALLLFIRLQALSLPTVFWYWLFGTILVCESAYFCVQKLLVKK